MHRTGKRTLLAVLLVGTAVLVALLVAESGSPQEPPPDTAGTAARAGATAGTMVGPGAPPAPAADGTVDPARREAATRGSEPRPGHLRVRVVRAEDDVPLPGAEVWFRDADEMHGLHDGLRVQLDHDGDPFAQLQHRGLHVRADERGEVDVPQQWLGTPVAGRHGDRAGFATLAGAEPEGGHRLRLAVQAALRVVVVQPDGTPAPGAPVAAFVVPEGGPEQRKVLGPTDGEGQLVVWDPAGLRRGTVATGNWSLGLASVGLQSLRVPFDPAAIPDEPLRLLLPPTGTVRLVVQDGEGRPFAGQFQVGLGWFEADGTHRYGRSTATDPDGTVTIPWVPLGLRLRAVVGVPHMAEEAAGPATPGQTVTIALAPGERDVVIRGRVLTETGAPLRGAPLDFRGEALPQAGEPTPWLMPTRTDQDGHFCLVWGGRQEPIAGIRGLLVIATLRRERDGRYAKLAVTLPPDRRHVEVPPVQLRLPEVVMTGRIELADGSPLDAATMAPEGGNPFLTWSPVRIEADGSFALLAQDAAPPALLIAKARGCLPTRVPVVRGARDVRVVLRRACALAVELRLPDALLPLAGHLRVELVGVGELGALSRAADGTIGAWDSLEPGEREVRVWLLGDPEPLAVERVTLGNGAPERQRLTFAPGAALRACRVTVLGPDGAPLAGRAMLVTTAQRPWEGHDARDAIDVEGGSATVLTRAEVLDFEITAEGCAPLQHRGPAGDVTLRLEAAPAVAVHVTGLDALPPDALVHFQVSDRDRAEVGLRTPSWAQAKGWPRRGFVCPLQQGRGVLRPERPARWKCELRIRLREGADWQVLPLPDASWAAGQAELVLDADAAAVQALLGGR